LGVRLPLLPPPFRRGRAVRRATVTREAQVRILPPEPCPRGRTGDDAGFSARKLRVRVPPGVLHVWLWGRWPPRRLRAPEIAGSTPAGQTLRGGGAAVLASLMSSRPWVRIPPARSDGGVAQLRRALACQARGRRFESGRPRAWWPWCSRKHPGLWAPLAPVRARPATPSSRTPSIGELNGP
jgi:hypothetical protein